MDLERLKYLAGITGNTANTIPMKDLGWQTNMPIEAGIEECFRRLADEQ